MRLCGEPSTDAKRKAALLIAIALANESSQTDIIDLRIRAP